LFIHGWACDHSFFEAQVAEFSRTHRVITVDLPGHGQSESMSLLRMQTFVDAIEGVRVVTKSNRWILAGHSLGAVVAREYARLYANRAQAMVLLDGAIYQLPPGEADRNRWAENITAMAKRFGPDNEKQVRERNISVFLSNMYTDATPRELRMSILRKVLATSPETAEGAMMSLADLKLWREESMNLPVLALRAGRQEPPGESSYLKQLFPQLQYKFLSGLSHFLMLEQPVVVNAEIRSFLKGRKLE